MTRKNVFLKIEYFLIEIIYDPEKGLGKHHLHDNLLEFTKSRVATINNGQYGFIRICTSYVHSWKDLEYSRLYGKLISIKFLPQSCWSFTRASLASTIIYILVKTIFLISFCTLFSYRQSLSHRWLGNKSKNKRLLNKRAFFSMHYEWLGYK